MANKIRLNVGGIEYLVVSDDDELSVRRIGDELNHRIDMMKRKNPTLSTTMAAMMTALDCCDDLHKANKEIEQLKAQLKNAVEDAACARFEGEQARSEIERLSAELTALRSRI
ncbi:MAG: cell division protein ZapA [Clostridia bacterium]|nr:cell division protein ZapA [Clostridia bacterium]MBR4282670.1 cell division protein ZapA [Clostridia bacterium]